MTAFRLSKYNPANRQFRHTDVFVCASRLRHKQPLLINSSTILWVVCTASNVNGFVHINSYEATYTFSLLLITKA